MPTLEVLTCATESALEAMFFTSILQTVDSAETEKIGSEEPWLVVRLQFQGDMRGEFRLGVSEGSANSIAANFLGLDVEELSSSDVRDVVCELTNMIAGSVVSSLESTRSFDLSHPEVDSSDKAVERLLSDGPTVFQLEDGFLAVWLRFHP